MNISVSEDGELLVEKVFNPICLQTEAGERMIISMRDSGFEFCYNGIWYYAKENKVTEIYPSKKS